VLVGIFGSSGERRALVQLPNGKVKQVRAGDSIQGVQVSAIGSDGVRLQGAGRDAVLRVAE
jgi:type IV pilus biogenesis protein PilP